jgi:hypothetical protein
VERGGGGLRGARVGARYEGFRRGGVGHRVAHGEQPRRQEYGREEPQEYRMKVDLPSFDGHLHIEDFLDWITEVEWFFEYMSISEERKVKLVAYKFKGGASAWWERLQLSQAKEGKRPVTSWFKMKRLLNARFLPPDFEQRLFQQYQECRQGARTVQAYIDDFYRLFARNELMETEAQQVARFLGGLRLSIQDKVTMHHIFTLTEAVSLATRVKRQMGRSRISTGEQNLDNHVQNQEKQLVVTTKTISQPTGPKWKTTSGSTSGAKQPVNIPPSNNPYVKPGLDKCFWCNQPGHRSNQCPKRQMVNLVESKAGGEEEEVS